MKTSESDDLAIKVSNGKNKIFSRIDSRNYSFTSPKWYGKSSAKSVYANKLKQFLIRTNRYLNDLRLFL